MHTQNDKAYSEAVYAYSDFPGSKNDWKGLLSQRPWSEGEITDFKRAVDAQAMMPFIAQALAWTKKARVRFFVGEFAPYQGYKLPQDPIEFVNLLLSACQFLAAQYHLEPDNRDKARQLTGMISIASEALFQDEAHWLSLRGGGLVRKGNKFAVTNLRLRQVQEICWGVAQELGEKPDHLFEQVLAHTAGGWKVLSLPTIYNCQTTSALRRALVEISKLDRDKDYERAVKLAHPLVVILTKCGLSFDSYLQALGILSLTELVPALQSLRGQNEELARVVAEEAPILFASGGSLDVTEVAAEVAQTCGFPFEPETQVMIKARCQTIDQYVESLLLIQGKTTAPAKIYWPTEIGARLRGVNITYHNSEGEVVNVIILDPRAEVTRSTETRGHEEAHRLHAMIIKALEVQGLLPPMSWEDLPSDIKETHALCMGSAIKRCFLEDRPVAIGESKPSGFVRALAEAHQPAFALFQIASWQYLQSLRSGQPPTRKDIAQLRKLQDQLVAELAPMSIGGGRFIDRSETAHPSSFFSWRKPLDGIIYAAGRARSVVNQGRTTVGQGSKTKSPLEDLLEREVGPDWLRDQRGRRLFAVSLLQSGLEPDSYLQTVKACAEDSDLLAAKMENLERIGITVG